jgi:hypothetical protein
MFKQKLFFVGILKVNDEKSRIRIQDPHPGSRSGSISQKQGSADPDPVPLQNVMDPEHCLAGACFSLLAIRRGWVGGVMKPKHAYDSKKLVLFPEPVFVT